MNKQELKGKGEQMKGKIREEVGKLTGNKTEQLRGKIEQTKGKAREKIGRLNRKQRPNRN